VDNDAKSRKPSSKTGDGLPRAKEGPMAAGAHGGIVETLAFCSMFY